jgi:DNA repair photolyase
LKPVEAAKLKTPSAGFPHLNREHSRRFSTRGDSAAFSWRDCGYCESTASGEGGHKVVDVSKCLSRYDICVTDGVQRLRAALSGRDPVASVVVLGADADPYQPGMLPPCAVRAVLQALRDAGHPVVISTRSPLITADLDLLSALANSNLLRLFVSIGTLDPDHARCLEPQASPPIARLEAVRRMAEAGLHVGVLLAPVIPGVTGTELESVLEAAAASGAGYADYAMLSLPATAREAFAAWLQRNCPDRARVAVGLLDAIGEDAPRETASPPALPGYGELFARRFDLACRRFLLDHVPAPLCCRRFWVPPVKA